MSELTRILSRIDAGDPAAAEQLLPLVYDELRKLAAAKLAQEKPGQTLQATALVHEAYLRLVGSAPRPDGDGVTADPHPSGGVYNSRGHFFMAAAEAMRRILIERARQKRSVKHGGQALRVDWNVDLIAASLPDDDLLALDEALSALEAHDPQAAGVVRLHCFGGLTIEQAAETLGISERTAYRDWSYARAWLHRALRSGRTPDPD